MLKNIVVMGGGNGSAISLVALKKMVNKCDLSAVIGMSDSGYSSGSIRRHFNMLPPGDILRAVLALSPYDYQLLKKIFYKNRVHNLPKLTQALNESRGPSLGHIFLALLTQYEGNFMHAVRALEEMLEAVGHAYPATLVQSDLVAQLSNGELVKGETYIDEPTYDRQHTIKKIWLDPTVDAYPEALAQLRQAHTIVLGPGDLYTSVIASLLPKGIFEVIEVSSAKLVYVVGNAYHAQGETGPTTLSGFIEQLERYLPRTLDYIIVNNAQLTPAQQQTYEERGWNLIDFDVSSDTDPRIIAGNYERHEGGLCPDKLSLIFKSIIGDRV